MPFRCHLKIFLILVLALAGFAAYAFANLGNWLLVSDPEPKKIDLVVSFAGIKNV